MGKPSKKKISRKKTTHHGKNKKLSRRKMKGGVAFNAPFSSLPSSTYIPLNPNVNENPSWNQIDARLLPAMKGGKKTRKKRGGMTQDEQFIYNSQLKRLGEIIVKRISDEIQKAKFLDVYSDDLERLTVLENRYKSLSEQVSQRNLPFGLEMVIIQLREIENELQQEIFDKEQSDTPGTYYEIELAHYLIKVNERFPEDTQPHLRPWEDKQLPYVGGPVGGKQARKSRTKRKIKGGSLVGTDIVTGLNTTDTNSVMAFGTTGGTDFMKDTILAKGIDSGPYLSEKTVPDPMLV